MSERTTKQKLKVIMSRHMRNLCYGIGKSAFLLEGVSLLTVIFLVLYTINYLLVAPGVPLRVIFFMEPYGPASLTAVHMAVSGLSVYFVMRSILVKREIVVNFIAYLAVVLLVVLAYRILPDIYFCIGACIAAVAIAIILRKAFSAIGRSLLSQVLFSEFVMMMAIDKFEKEEENKERQNERSV